MSCQDRPSFLGSTRTQAGLEVQLENTILAVRDSLYSHADTPVPSTDYSIKILAGGASKRLVPSETKIVELPRADFFSNYPRLTPGGARGIYDYKYGKIILCEGLWCRKTLIHETLHSVSFFSARPDLGRKMLNIVEGLTEFLTGFVMYRRYPYCYSAWKSGLYEVCSVTYPSVAKLWGAFCRFMPITEPAKIYFWDRNSNWETRYSDFLNNMHRAGYPKFGDILQNPKPTMDIKLLQECLKNFGKKNFGDIYYESLETCLDFSQMLPGP